MPRRSSHRWLLVGLTLVALLYAVGLWELAESRSIVGLYLWSLGGVSLFALREIESGP